MYVKYINSFVLVPSKWGASQNLSLNPADATDSAERGCWADFLD